MEGTISPSHSNSLSPLEDLLWTIESLCPGDLLWPLKRVYYFLDLNGLRSKICRHKVTLPNRFDEPYFML